MPNLPSSKSSAEFQLMYYTFGLSQVPISQAAVALKQNVNAAASGSMNLLGIPMPYAGSIVGVAYQLTANKTAGVLSVTPTLNTVAIAAPTLLVAVAMANASAKKVQMVDAQLGGARFLAGDLLGLKLTSDASYLPTTNDLVAWVYVCFENVQL